MGSTPPGQRRRAILPELSCSEQSIRSGELLRGTATAEVESWLLLEVREGWGRDLASSRLPERVHVRLAALTRQHRALRIQLIRQPERHGPLSVFAVQAGVPGVVRRLEMARLEELCDLDLQALLLDDAPASPCPIYLVCTHGRRDPCCGRHGFAVYQALTQHAADEEVWQSSHLGGHRFAATALYLPAGLQYGRLEPSEVTAMLVAHTKGRLHDLRRLRGQTRYARPAQAADIWLREQQGLLALDALQHVSLRSLQVGRHEAAFRDAYQHHTLTLEARRGMTAQQTSCGGGPPELPTHFEVLRYQARAIHEETCAPPG